VKGVEIAAQLQYAAAIACEGVQEAVEDSHPKDLPVYDEVYIGRRMFLYTISLK
jgi:hypothetical protein